MTWAVSSLIALCGLFFSLISIAFAEAPMDSYSATWDEETPGWVSALAGGDYNGDGTSDAGIYRPWGGLWSIRNITRVYFGAQSVEAYPWTVMPVSGDYNGDGTADIAVFKQETDSSLSMLWAIRGITRAYFGAPGDYAVPADYDGDDSSDIAIFSQAGVWAVKGITRTNFGSEYDIPVPGNYNGNLEGMIQIAVFKQDGRWAIKDYTSFYLGGGGGWGVEDMPIPGNYTGDGKWEAAIYRIAPLNPSLWVIRDLTRFWFGYGWDYPLRANYKGDGYDRIGVFDGYGGAVWVLRDYTRFDYGTSYDIPIMR